jgi:hypothetical protein
VWQDARTYADEGSPFGGLAPIAQVAWGGTSPAYEQPPMDIMKMIG